MKLFNPKMIAEAKTHREKSAALDLARSALASHDPEFVPAAEFLSKAEKARASAPTNMSADYQRRLDEVKAQRPGQRAKAAAEAPSTSSAPERPDFSHLHGLARTTAAMQWETEQKAGAGVAPAPGATIAPKATASGVTAADIAAEIITQQKAQARKPTGLSRTIAAFQAQNVSKQSN